MLKTTLNKILGKGPFFWLAHKFCNKFPLNIVKSENIQTFCRQARHFFYLNFDIFLPF